MSLDDAVELIRLEVAFLMRDARIPLEEVTAESSLIDDLMLDSLSFVDLTLALERVFEIREFPMQEWVDEQAEKEDRRFTLGALARACLDARGKRADVAVLELGGH